VKHSREDTAVKAWIIEGKYTSGPGSEWEEVDEVSETDTGGPGDELVGLKYAQWLTREYRTAHAPHQVRLRPKRVTD
jgi:hypothetical protein